MSIKKARGQFYTKNNPFTNDLFSKWLNSIPGITRHNPIIEPFSGGGNIPLMLKELGLRNSWYCYDIDPPSKPNHMIHINRRDTLADYPRGFKIAITNPPYLSKRSATVDNLPFPDTKHTDLYKLCLEVMLDNNDYVTAILPESFIVSGLYHERLYGVVSLTSKMFDDTDHPVCMALFKPLRAIPTKEFLVYSGNQEIGYYHQIRCSLKQPKKALNIRFNDPAGEIALFGADNTKEQSIWFDEGDCIDPYDVSSKGRINMRITIVNNTIPPKYIIDTANRILGEYRAYTHDIFLTAFKGLRKDGKYRRRLDRANARRILSLAVGELQCLGVYVS